MAKESTLKNMVVTLTLITLITSTLLGVVYTLTKGPIEEAMAAKVNEAIGSVAPQFNNDPSLERFELEYRGRGYKVYPAKMDEEVTGYVVESQAAGFGGTISLMIGFEIEGTIVGISVLSHTETPGLGDKIESKKSNFSLQFEGKSPEQFKLAVRQDGGDIDAITASTITSRAFCDAVETGWELFKLCKLQMEEKGESYE